MSGVSFAAGPLGPTLADLLAEGREAGAFPEAAVEVRRGGRVLGEATLLAVAPRACSPRDVRWDLASLTKPRAIATLAMRAVTAGQLDLDAPLFPDLPAHLTARRLLGHRAGLPAFFPWAALLPPGHRPGSPATRFALASLVRHVASQSAPGPALYSDIGYMLLGAHFEGRLGPLRRLIPGYGRARPPADPERFATCGLCPLRGRALRGEVHDPQAFADGGASGHAGLFGTARAVAAWADGLRALAAGAPTARSGPVAGIAGDVVRHFWAPAVSHADSSTWRLGWDGASAAGSSAGTTVGADAVGHLGFTGTSVWVEPARALVTVLLSNRVALGEAAQPRLRAFRPRFHDAVRAAADAMA